jgi:RNA polymerase sigma-70 factor, ECF subfamily
MNDDSMLIEQPDEQDSSDPLDETGLQDGAPPDPKEDETSTADTAAIEEYKAVQKVQKGDRKEFSRLVQKYQDSVVSLCTHLMRNRAEGEDASQDAFVNAYRRIDSFRGESRFFTWLYSIAVNVCRNKQRSFWERLFKRSASVGAPDVDKDLSETIEILDSSPWPSEQLEKKELRDQIKRVLMQMPTRYRELVVLRDIKEMSYADIAAILEVPLGTVKSGLARARLAMQVELRGLVDGI